MTMTPRKADRRTERQRNRRIERAEAAECWPDDGAVAAGADERSAWGMGGNG